MSHLIMIKRSLADHRKVALLKDFISLRIKKNEIKMIGPDFASSASALQAIHHPPSLLKYIISSYRKLFSLTLVFLC